MVPHLSLRPSKDRLVAIASVILLLSGVAALYGPAIHSGLLSDDWGLSAPDPHVWRSFLGHWFGGGKGTFYRPLSRIFIYGEARVFGYSGLGQHWVSILLFFSSALLLARAHYRYLGTVASLIALVFVLYNPLQVETVSWVASQTDLLAGFMLTLLCITVARPANELTSRHVVVAGVLAFLTYLAKDSAVVIGPLAGVFFLAHMLNSGASTIIKNKAVVAITASQILMWLLYLGWRKISLGAVFPPPADGFVPEHGLLWHYGLNIISIMREYSTLLAPEAYHSRSFATATDAIWPALIVLSGIVMLVATRAYLSAMLLVCWLVALLPAIIAANPYFYPENGFNGGRRYLYIPTLFLGCFIGSLFKRPAGEPFARERFPLVYAALCFLALHFGMQSYPRIEGYRAAQRIRDKIHTELNKALQTSPSGGTLLVQRLPDSVMSYAYIFRAGFADFAKIYFPNFEVRQDKTFNFAAATSSQKRVFTIDYTGVSDIQIREARELRKALQARANPRPPYVLDPSQNKKSISQLFPNPDVTIVDQADKYITLKITGKDPSIGIGVVPFEPYYAYQRAFLTYELLDAANQASQDDLFQVIWSLQDDRTGFANFPIKIAPGKQTATFDLLNNTDWYRDGSLKWMRFDLGGVYSGRVRVYAIGLE